MGKEQYTKEKMQKLTTSEILDEVGKFSDLNTNTDWDKKRAYENELETREPFDHLKHKIERLQKRINKLEKNIEDLNVHKHSRSGEVFIPINQR